VGKSGRDYFSTHNEQLYDRDEASARGRYMGDFPEPEQGNHVQIEVVRPDTPPTPGGPESVEHTTIIGTLEPAIVDLDTPPTPGDTSLELRAPTPPTPGTPVVWDLFECAPGSTNILFSPPMPGRGAGGDTKQSPFLSLSLSPMQEHDSPPTPGRTVTQVDWVAQNVAELEVSDPAMAAFVAECDARDARAPTAPPHQGHMTPRDESKRIQSKGI